MFFVYNCIRRQALLFLIFSDASSKFVIQSTFTKQAALTENGARLGRLMGSSAYSSSSLLYPKNGSPSHFIKVSGPDLITAIIKKSCILKALQHACGIQLSGKGSF